MTNPRALLTEFATEDQLLESTYAQAGDEGYSDLIDQAVEAGALQEGDEPTEVALLGDGVTWFITW